jgi:hypothetical protein
MQAIDGDQIQDSTPWLGMDQIQESTPWSEIKSRNQHHGQGSNPGFNTMARDQI